MKKDPYSLQLKYEYNNYKRSLTKLIRETKTEYQRDRINKNKNNTGNLWKSVNEIFNKNEELEQNP